MPRSGTDEQEGASRLEQLVLIVNYLAAEPPNVWTAEWSSLIWSSGDLVTELVSVSLGDRDEPLFLISLDQFGPTAGCTLLEYDLQKIAFFSLSLSKTSGCS